MTKEPREMMLEEQISAYGKPKKGPTVLEILGSTTNVNHDRITIDALTEGSKRLQITFTQKASRQFVEIVEIEAEGPSKPSAN